MIERLGERTLVHVRLRDGAQVTAQDRGISTVEPGETVRLKFDTSALHLFGADGRGLARAAWKRCALSVHSGSPPHVRHPGKRVPQLRSRTSGTHDPLQAP